MSSIAEIEAAIEKLPAPQVDELAAWLEAWRVQRRRAAMVESWLQRARGVTISNITTFGVLTLTRSEQGMDCTFRQAILQKSLPENS